MSTTIGEPPEDASSQRTPPVPGGQSAPPPIPPRLNTSPSPSSTGQVPGSGPGTTRAPSRGQRMAGKGATFIGKRFAGSAADKLARGIVNKLNKEIERGNELGPFLFMLAIAGLKDGFDVVWTKVLLFIQTLIVVGQITSIVLVILKFFLGALLSSLLIYFLIKKGWILRLRTRILVYAILFLLGNLPVAEFFPFETLTILWAWRNVRKRAKKAKRKLEKLRKKLMKKGELEELNRELRYVPER